MSSPFPSSASVAQLFRERGGAAWSLLQEQTDAQLDPLGRAAMARLALLPGARVLDVGCGCGQTLLELAALVGPTGHVLGVDISEPMLARAAERIAANPEVALLCADAQTHALPIGEFDAVYSRFGVMFFEDARVAFANLRRALRPGGQLAFVCWQGPSRNPWAALPLQAVTRLLPEGTLPTFLSPDSQGPFYFSNTDRVNGILSDAGFSDIAITPFETSMHIGGAMTLEEGVAYCHQIGPAARAMAGAPEELRPALESAVSAALAPFVTARGLWMDGAAFIVTARIVRPSGR
jgi:ubiquinone/menaquinone biosynthesis C-methylase UbiE